MGAACRSLNVSLAEVISNLVGEIGDKLGSLCQVASPDGIGLEGWWNAWEPRQRTWVGRRQLTVRLPAGYVQASTGLGYATAIHSRVDLVPGAARGFE